MPSRRRRGRSHKAGDATRRRAGARHHGRGVPPARAISWRPSRPAAAREVHAQLGVPVGYDERGAGGPGLARLLAWDGEPGPRRTRARAADLPARRPARRGRRSLSRAPPPVRLPGIVDSHCHLQDHGVRRPIATPSSSGRTAAGLARIVVPAGTCRIVRGGARARRPPSPAPRAGGRHPSAIGRPRQRRRTAPGGGARRRPGGGGDRRDRARLLTATSQPAGRAARDARAACSTSPPAASCRSSSTTATRTTPSRAALVGWAATPGRPAVAACSIASVATRRWRSSSRAAGFLVCFALPVAFSSSRGPRAAAAALPDEALLVETDAPYLGPGGAGTRNEPTTVLRVAAELARLRGTHAGGDRRRGIASTWGGCSLARRGRGL